MQRRRQGFTLLEMSIVLVIVGLVIGGVLVGRELIEAANIRSQISQIEKFSTAAQTFRLKYGCTPGDCAQATSIGVGVSGGPGDNGNGDGKLTTACFHAEWLNAYGDYNFEPLNFWYHLARANLIPDIAYAGSPFAGFSGQARYMDLNVPQTTMPASKLAGNVINPTTFGCATTIGTLLSTNGFHLASPPASSTGGSNVWWDKTIPALTAKTLDSKVDDGLPLSGNIVGDNAGTKTEPCQNGNWCSYCNIPMTATNEYNSAPDGKCGLDFLKQF